MNIQYVAGLFDGEGYARIARSQPNKRLPHIRYQVFAGIGMTHKPVIKMLASEFGGRLYVNDHSRRNANHRPQFVWLSASQDAAKFLRQILPYLIVKREEAKLCLKLQESIDTYRYQLAKDEWKDKKHKIWAYRHSLFEKVTALKHVWYPINDEPIKVSE